MKRLLIALLMMGMIVSLTACGGNAASQASVQSDAAKSKAENTAAQEAAEKTEAVSSEGKAEEAVEKESAEESEADEPASLDEKDLPGLLEVVEKSFSEASQKLSAEAETVLADLGDDYASLVENRSRLTDWYAMAEEESAALYERMTELSTIYYKGVAATVNMDEFDEWDSVLDDFYDAWDEGMSDYYDTWDDVFDDLYKKWDRLIDDAPDSVDYSEISDLWSSVYEEHSDAWSAMYGAHSDSWSDIYGRHSAVWSGFYADNTDVDKIISDYLEEQEKKEQEEAEKEEPSDPEQDAEASESPASDDEEKNDSDEEDAQTSDGSASESYPPVTVVSDDEIILGPDNEYMIISNIDFSECTMEEGYFSGQLYFTSKTTQAYVDTFNDYVFRQIVFGLYDKDGNLRGEEIAQNNYIYEREYIGDEWTYVMSSANKPITDVRVEKIIISK